MSYIVQESRLDFLISMPSHGTGTIEYIFVVNYTKIKSVEHLYRKVINSGMYSRVSVFGRAYMGLKSLGR
jgi:hypothetical protein